MGRGRGVVSSLVGKGTSDQWHYKDLNEVGAAVFKSG